MPALIFQTPEQSYLDFFLQSVGLGKGKNLHLLEGHSGLVYITEFCWNNYAGYRVCKGQTV